MKGQNFPGVNPYSDQSGQGIIQVLIGIALMGIMTMVFMSIMEGQSKETRALSEKMASLELEREIIANLANPLLCSSIFSNSNLATTNDSLILVPTVSAIAPQKINFKTIPGPSGQPSLATVGAQVSPMASGLYIQNQNGIQVSVTSATTASLTMSFDGSKLVRALRPLGPFNISIQTTTVGSTTKISGCSAGQSSGLKGLKIFSSSTNWTVPAGVTQIFVTAVGGGGGGSAGGSGANIGAPMLGASGGNGGSSTIQSCPVTGGGGGGGQSATSCISTNGGVAGTASGGSVNLPGFPGGPCSAGWGTGSGMPGAPLGPTYLLSFVGSAGGGGLGSNAGASGAGASGGASLGGCSVTPGANLAVTVGAGGAPGDSSALSGLAGVLVVQW